MDLPGRVGRGANPLCPQAVKEILLNIIASLVNAGIWPAKAYTPTKTKRVRET